MSYRSRKPKPRTSGSAFKASDYVPLWNQQHTDTTSLMAEMVFDKLGVIDLRSYFEVLAIPIAICTVIGCVYGASHWGLLGAVLGVLAGLAAPAAIPWICIVAGYAVVLALAFIAAWTVLIYGAVWLLCQ